MKILGSLLFIIIASCNSYENCSQYTWDNLRDDSVVYQILYNIPIDTSHNIGQDNIEELVANHIDSSNLFAVLSQTSDGMVDVSLITKKKSILSISKKDNYYNSRAKLDIRGNVISSKLNHDELNLINLFFKLGCFNGKGSFYDIGNFTPINESNILNLTKVYSNNVVELKNNNKDTLKFSYRFEQRYSPANGSKEDEIEVLLRADSEYQVNFSKWSFLFGQIDIRTVSGESKYLIGLRPIEREDIMRIHSADKG